MKKLSLLSLVFAGSLVSSFAPLQASEKKKTLLEKVRNQIEESISRLKWCYKGYYCDDEDMGRALRDILVAIPVIIALSYATGAGLQSSGDWALDRFGHKIGPKYVKPAQMLYLTNLGAGALLKAPGAIAVTPIKKWIDPFKPGDRVELKRKYTKFGSAVANTSYTVTSYSRALNEIIVTEIPNEVFPAAVMQKAEGD